MPQLPTNTLVSNIKQLFLPSTATQADGTPTPDDQKAWVKLDVGENLVADLEALNDNDKNSTVSRVRVLASRIKEWNFTNPEGQPEPITFENVCKLDPNDLTYLLGVKATTSTQPLSIDDKKK